MKSEKKSHRIYEYLKSIIVENKYREDYRLPSENELAKLFGTSRMSAQLATDRLEREGYLVKRRGSGAFVNAAILGDLKAPCPQEAKIAVVTPLGSRFVSFIYQSINDYFRKAGILPAFFWSNSAADDEFILRTLREKGYEGIIIYPFDSTTPGLTLTDLVKRNYPIVLIDRYYNNLDSYTVSSNHFASSYKLVRYFYEHMRRKILYVSEPLMITSLRHRYNGFTTAVSHFPGLKQNSTILFYDTKKKDEFIENVQKLIERGAIDSVISASGLIASGVLSAVKQCGQELGKDIMLGFFDEEADFDSVIDFPYVKLLQDTDAIGKKAAEIIHMLLLRADVPERAYKIPTILKEINFDQQ